MAWRKTLKGKWSSYSSYSELNSDHHQLSSWEHIKENQQIVDLNSKMVAIFALFHNIWSPTPHPPPPIKLCIILTILLIGSQLSIVPSLYFIGDNRFPLRSPWKSCDPPNPATTSPLPPPPKARILTGLKVKLLFTGGILHLISGWRYNKLFEGLFLFRKIIIV